VAHYLLGIDEAGYGPNLGPFVMSSACFAVPEAMGHDLWQPLRLAVKRASGKPDGRLVVDDSKEVYSPKTGLGQLEKQLWPWLAACHSDVSSLGTLWQAVTLTPWETVAHEPWLDTAARLPVQSPSASSTALLHGVLSQTGISLQGLHTCVIPARQFNTLTTEADSKAAVPLYCVNELLRKLPPKDTVTIVIDRLGGRQRYRDQVCRWFPGETVEIVSETPNVSSYQVGSRVTISFQVEADQHSFCVALASMLSKYWREVCMGQFNAWFQKQQPGIAPTAGYPLDATRFWDEAKPTRDALKLVDADWWRTR
jgi:ribonuclease HII